MLRTLGAAGFAAAAGFELDSFFASFTGPEEPIKMESVMILSCIARVDKTEAMLNLGQNEQKNMTATTVKLRDLRTDGVHRRLERCEQEERDIRLFETYLLAVRIRPCQHRS